MNTPKPCDTCKNLYVDCMQEDNPEYIAECKLKRTPINNKCHYYEEYE